MMRQIKQEDCTMNTTEQWIHCSAEKITKTKFSQNFSLLNDTLFFYEREYASHLSCGDYVYHLYIDPQKDIISVEELHDKEIINKIYEGCLKYQINEGNLDLNKKEALQLAEDLLDTSKNPYNDEFDGFLTGEEAGEWQGDLRVWQAECARKMGYIGALDEGALGEERFFLVSINEREHLLKYSHRYDGDGS